MKYYDRLKNQIIYIKEEATPVYWDKVWEIDNIKEKIVSTKKNVYVVRITRKFLNPGDGPILEGGCGLGYKVASLKKNGYECIGIDNARKTVEVIQKNIPELDIRFGNVKNLNFSNGYFAGYWSIGVIEHFWNGYDDIAKEMFRVIKPGGYLFLSFPFMSIFRKIKARLGFYEKFNNNDISNFYQFALNTESVVKKFDEIGFRLIKKEAYDLLFGIKDEIPQFNSIIDLGTKNIIAKITYQITDNLISKKIFGNIFGHSVLLVFKKTVPN